MNIERRERIDVHGFLRGGGVEGSPER